MLRRLLDARSQRIVATVELLVDAEGWVTAAELASATGTSKRTESDDIALIRKRWGALIGLESSIKEGFRIDKRNSAMISMVLKDLFSESSASKFLEKLFSTPGMTIEFYGKGTFTSTSTLMRLLPKVESFLAENEMGILNRRGCYEVIADDEQHLRDFYASFLLELKGMAFDQEPCARIIRKILTHVLEPEAAAAVGNDEMLMGYYSMFYSVSLLRESQGNSIVSARSVESEVSDDDLSFLVARYGRLSKASLQPIHEYIVRRFHGWDSDGEHALVQAEAARFADSICKALCLGTNGDPNQKLQFIVENSYLLTKLRRHRVRPLFDHAHSFAITVERENPAFYKLFESNADAFSRNTSVDISAQMGTIMLRTCLAFPSCACFASPKKALVVSNLGARHATFLAEAIGSLFTRGSFKMLETSMDPRDPYDIVITNAPDLRTGSKPVILIEDYPKCEDFCNILRELSR